MTAIPTTDPEARLRAWERRTDQPLTALSAGFLALYAVQVLATRPGDVPWQVIDAVLWVVWAVFVVDVVVRLRLARDRWRFLRDNPLDVLVVLAPFLRFLRLVRLLGAVSVLTRTLRDDLRGRVSSYLVVTVSLLSFVAALAAFEAERDAPEATITTFGGALWWVLTTITTVGYGDHYPVTVEGRLVAAGLMLAGIAVLGTVTGAIASWFTDRIEETRLRETEAAAAAASPGKDAARTPPAAGPPVAPGTPAGSAAPGAPAAPAVSRASAASGASGVPGASGPSAAPEASAASAASRESGTPGASAAPGASGVPGAQGASGTPGAPDPQTWEELLQELRLLRTRLDALEARPDR